MFGYDDLKQTRLFQEILAEGKLEGKLEVISTLLARGFTVTEIAEILKLEVERVEQQKRKLEGKQEGKLEGKLEVIPALLARGFTVTEIAEILKLEVEQVEQEAQQSATDNN